MTEICTQPCPEHSEKVSLSFQSYLESQSRELQTSPHRTDQDPSPASLIWRANTVGPPFWSLGAVGNAGTEAEPQG